MIVGLSTDEFNRNKKGKATYFSYQQRKVLLESLRYVDLVIPEFSWEQKSSDILEFKADIFAIGNDWSGKFDELKKYCEVVYLDRTPEISTTQIKNDLGGGGRTLYRLYCWILLLSLTEFAKSINCGILFLLELCWVQLDIRDLSLGMTILIFICQERIIKNF